MKTANRFLQTGAELNFSLWFVNVCGAAVSLLTVVTISSLLGYWYWGLKRGFNSGAVLTVGATSFFVFSFVVFSLEARKYRGVTVREDGLEVGGALIRFSSIIEVSLRNRHSVRVVYEVESGTRTLAIGEPTYRTRNLSGLADELMQAAGLDAQASPEA